MERVAKLSDHEVSTRIAERLCFGTRTNRPLTAPDRAPVEQLFERARDGTCEDYERLGSANTLVDLGSIEDFNSNPAVGRRSRFGLLGYIRLRNRTKRAAIERDGTNGTTSVQVSSQAAGDDDPIESANTVPASEFFDPLQRLEQVAERWTTNDSSSDEGQALMQILGEDLEEVFLPAATEYGSSAERITREARALTLFNLQQQQESSPSIDLEFMFESIILDRMRAGAESSCNA